MPTVIKKPDTDIDPVWDLLTDQQKQWYQDFVRGTVRGDKKALERIFINIPDEIRERIMRELHYEWKAHERQRFTIPKARFPKYSEFDYGWHQTRPTQAKKQVNLDYYGQGYRK